MGQPDVTRVAIIQRVIETFGLEDRVEFVTLYHVELAGELAEIVQRSLGITEDERVEVHWSPSDYDVRRLIEKHVKHSTRSVLSGMSVQLDMTLSKLLPRARRRSRWLQLSDALGWQLPDLEPSPFWTCLLLPLFIGPWVVGWVLLASRLDRVGGVLAVVLGLVVTLLGFMGMAASVAAAILVAKRIAGPIAIPHQVTRVRDLVDSIPADQRRQFVSQLRERRNARIWPTVQQIVAEEFGMSVDDVTESTRL